MKILPVILQLLAIAKYQFLPFADEAQNAVFKDSVRTAQ